MKAEQTSAKALNPFSQEIVEIVILNTTNFYFNVIIEYDTI